MRIRINGKVYESILGDSDTFKIGDVVLTRFYDHAGAPRFFAKIPRGLAFIHGAYCTTPGGALRSLRSRLARATLKM